MCGRRRDGQDASAAPIPAAAIRPLNPDMVLIGRALPVLSVDVFEEKITGTANKLMAKPFGLMLEALDDLRTNEVYVNTGSSPRNALWGELMTVRAKSSALPERC